MAATIATIATTTTSTTPLIGAGDHKKPAEEITMTFAVSASSNTSSSTSSESVDSKATLPWIEKYRPFQLDEIISHTEIIGTIKKLLEKGELPHLLLYGPPGTGKTSALLAIARQIN